MSNQGEIKMELQSTEDIVEQVIVGYRNVFYGADIQVPIYETRINRKTGFLVSSELAKVGIITI